MITDEAASSTIWISSSVNSYSSHTRASISTSIEPLIPLNPLTALMLAFSVVTPLSASVIPPLYNCNLFLRQPVQLVGQRVDLAIGGFNLTLVEGFVSGDDGNSS